MKPCKHKSTLEGCRVCFLYDSDPRYRALWDTNGEETAELPLKCPYLGEEIKEKTRECPGCNGKTRLKLFPCHHPAREPEEVTLQDCQKCPYRPQKVSPEKRLILKNYLSPGDVLVMSAALYSLHRKHPGTFLTAVDTSCPSVWDFNPDVVEVGEGFEILDMHYPLIQECNQWGVHMMDGYCQYLEDKLGVRVPLMTNRPRVYVSNREKGWMDQVEQDFHLKKPWWLLNAGVKQDFTAKQWNGYQEVVDRLIGQVQFVQVGKLEHVHKPLRGVVNLLGRTDDRQLIRLVWNSSGVLCGTTFLMHLAAALEKPSVIVAGGREPRQWNSYPKQHLISTVGAMDCCKDVACWKSRTVKLNDGSEQDGSLCERPVFTEPAVPTCMALIRPEEVAEAIRRCRV